VARRRQPHAVGNDLPPLAARGGFKFFNPPKAEKPAKDTSEQEKADRALADQIIALRNAGMSRCRASAKLGIGNRKLERILTAFGINFPLKVQRD
jgi:hypothetical protein